MADGLTTILDRAKARDALSHYQLLGLAAGADAAAVSDAYYHLLRTYHPDRFASMSNPEHRRLLALFCARIGEARRVLLHPRLRSEYDTALQGGASTSAPTATTKQRPLIESRDPKHPQARSMYERAKQLAVGGDLRGAKAQLDLARQFDPNSKKIAALLEELSKPPPKSTKTGETP